MKRRVTLVVDDDERKRRGWAPVPDDWWKLTGVTVESDEPIPDPDRVQEFRVRIVTKATANPHQAYHVFNRLTKADFGWPFMPDAVTVTEVDPTEVER